MKTIPATRLLLLLTLIAPPLIAADWPQYRGPNGDGSSSEKILTAWPSEGPKLLWKAPLGPSFGSFVVSGGKAFCFVQRKVDDQDREVALALEAGTGKELWAVPLGKATYDRQGGDGPRSTPAVAGGRVYLLGAYQVLTCLDAETGKQIWQHDIVSEFGGRIIKWNSAASPLLGDDLVFVNGGGAGQALLAFDQTDGKLVWKGEDDAPTHSSPVLATIHGVSQVIFYTQKGLVSVVPKTGQVLWRFAFPHQTSSASSPIVWSNIVYCSAAYGVGAGACQIAREGKGWTATELWRKKGELQNHWTSPVCQDGFIYGIYGRGQQPGAPLKCVDIRTGEEKWSRDGFGGGGATILVAGNVLVQCDRGPLVLVAAKPDAYQELARAEIYGGQCWTMPVISNGKIFARNPKEGFCLDVTPDK